MIDLTDENDRIDWATYEDLTPVAQTCLLLVAMYDGDAWRSLIVQAAQEGIDVSDRHVRRTLSELEVEGLVEASGPTKQREMYSVTDDGRKVLTGMRDGLQRALE